MGPSQYIYLNVKFTRSLFPLVRFQTNDMEMRNTFMVSELPETILVFDMTVHHTNPSHNPLAAARYSENVTDMLLHFVNLYSIHCFYYDKICCMVNYQ